MKKLLVVTAAIAAAVAVCVAVTIPPRRLALVPFADGTVAGIIHVHTNRSDGLSGPDEIAAAAARAGLKFVVFTDHGDGTRAPDPPTYRSGVLCLDGVEISTTGGHYVALDLPVAPYPLGGEPRDVVEDVRRLGGFGIAAHPDSPKPQLRWREWTAPFDAIELLNPDTSWRVIAQQPGWRSKLRIFNAVIDYPFRAPEVMANLIQPTGVLYNWEALTRRRRVVAIAGADAHAKLAPRNADPGSSRFVVSLPGYEASFRVLSIHVRPDAPLSGRAPDDAALVLRGIRAGHLYTAIDAVASPSSFEFTASNARGAVAGGDVIAGGGSVSLHVRSNAPADFITIVHEGMRTLVARRGAADFTVQTEDHPGVYWVEIVSTGRTPELTWVRSNPVYVRAAEPLGNLPGRLPASRSQSIFDGKSTTGWHVEHDPTSLAAVDPAPIVSGTELRFGFGLAGGSLVGQVAALAFDTPAGVTASDRVTFTIRGEQPMRVSVQLRGGEGDAAGERWQRSIYIDETDEERTMYFDDLMPVGETHTFKPPLDRIRSVLFVVDTTNTKPGASGRIWIKKAALQK